MDTDNNTTSQHQHSKNTGMAILAYLGPLIVIPFLTDAKNDPFVKFHLKQALPLLVFEVVGSFIFWFPVVGWALWVLSVVLLVKGVMNAANGVEKELPIIGKYAQYFNF